MVFYFDIDAPEGGEKWIVYMVRPRKKMKEERRRTRAKANEEEDCTTTTTAHRPSPTSSKKTISSLRRFQQPQQQSTGPRQVREREPDRARPAARHLVPRRGHELGARLPPAAELAAPARRRLCQARQGRRRGGQQRRRRRRRRLCLCPVPKRQVRSSNSSSRRQIALPTSPHRACLARDPQPGPRRLLPAGQAQQHLGQQGRRRRRRLHSGAQPLEERQDGHGAGERLFFFSLCVRSREGGGGGGVGWRKKANAKKRPFKVIS